MNLFQAILGLQYPDKYRLHQFVIHSCASQDHVAIAEILFTRLNEGYTGNAGGFSFYLAGISVNTGYGYGAAQWEQAEQWAMENMLVEEVHQAECLRHQSIFQDTTSGNQEMDRLQDLMMQKASLEQQIVELDVTDGLDNLSEAALHAMIANLEAELGAKQAADKVEETVQVVRGLALVTDLNKILGIELEA
ncbi:hypothetical protein Slin14017_G022030 [Septoria linicola]|nr:hypothetical protein Slin14017_G022030 [Septoria linicola]